jgi:hypothetical protein
MFALQVRVAEAICKDYPVKYVTGDAEFLRILQFETEDLAE